MRRLFIDLETYSEVDIRKAGLYRYVQSPSFQIMLFAYSRDGEDPVVIDLLQGETIPEDIVRALWDPSVTKHAYNAAFEFYCLSKFYHTFPEQWQCTMVHGLYCGYPAGLEAINVAMQLPDDKQKSAVGRGLISYFCKPCKATKTNGHRTRNLPHHEPERWTLFKAYCAQDVVAEMAVEDRLSPWPVPDEEWRLWHLDIQINSYGVNIDQNLVTNALSINDTVMRDLEAEAIDLSGLDNPNSVSQLKKWLEKESDLDVSNLNKSSVKQMINATADDSVKRVLEIRQEMSKTSIKKYTAMQEVICSDGRVRGLLQHYGANRTGRWCLTGDHEVLTPAGWISMADWSGGEIACWSPSTEAISFQAAKALSFAYTGDMISVNGQRCEQICTPDHKMPYLDKNGDWAVANAEAVFTRRVTIPFTGYRRTEHASDPEKIRVLIMVQADGHYTREGDLRLHFKKERKIERCKSLLRKAEVPFVERQYPQNDSACIIIKNRSLPLWLRQFQDKTFGPWILNESPDVIFDELPYWDGYRGGPNSLQYTTTNKQNAELLQAAAVLSGRSATLLTKERERENWNTAYILNIWNAPGRGTSIRREQINRVPFSGLVFCAETKTGFFIVRRNGKVWVTGNSGRLVQVQNLPRNKIETLEYARNLVKTGRLQAIKVIYGNVPDTLSQLIRTAFIPSEGRIFLVADFSAIEARIIAWLAGEQWRLDVFATHGKIYEASAAAMFNVPVELISKGHPEYSLRAKGKVAELALGYQGGTAALIAMGALEMGLSEEELPEIVARWRKASPRIKDLWYLMQGCAIEAIKTGRAQTGRGITFTPEELGEERFLTIRLPSGRKLFYVKPFLAMNQWDSDAFFFYQRDQTSGKWVKEQTYGGKLTENIVQAIARDCLALALTRLAEAGFQTVMHIHDEVVIDCPLAQADLEKACEIMGQPIPWAPGLLLRADGFTTKFYMKN